MEKEIYNGRYTVTSAGDVYSNYIVSHRVNKKRGEPKKLKQFDGKDGYPVVTLCFNGSRKNHKIHRLVLSSFVENPQNKPFACHKNGDIKDNNIDNLYWGTRKENGQDMVRHGNSLRGQKQNKCKLQEIDVLSIRGQFGNKSAKNLAKDFSVSVSNIYRIINRETWNYV